MFEKLVKGEAEATIGELIQVHRMAIEARQLGGDLYKKLGQDWWPAAEKRAHRLAAFAEAHYEAGELSVFKLRLANANKKLTLAKRAAEIKADNDRRAATNAKGSSQRASGRRVVFPPKNR